MQNVAKKFNWVCKSIHNLASIEVYAASYYSEKKNVKTVTDFVFIQHTIFTHGPELSASTTIHHCYHLTPRDHGVIYMRALDVIGNIRGCLVGQKFTNPRNKKIRCFPDLLSTIVYCFLAYYFYHSKNVNVNKNRFNIKIKFIIA